MTGKEEMLRLLFVSVSFFQEDLSTGINIYLSRQWFLPQAFLIMVGLEVPNLPREFLSPPQL